MSHILDFSTLCDGSPKCFRPWMSPTCCFLGVPSWAWAWLVSLRVHAKSRGDPSEHLQRALAVSPAALVLHSLTFQNSASQIIILLRSANSEISLFNVVSAPSPWGSPTFVAGKSPQAVRRDICRDELVWLPCWESLPGTSRGPKSAQCCLVCLPLFASCFRS